MTDLLASDLGLWAISILAVSPFGGVVLYNWWKSPKSLEDSETSES